MSCPPHMRLQCSHEVTPMECQQIMPFWRTLIERLLAVKRALLKTQLWPG